MKILSWFLSCFLFFVTASAQNLVPNFSFEEISKCPENVAQLNNATGWKACRSSPDLITRCAKSSDVTAPQNAFGYQEPADGNSYIQLVLWGHAGFREYAGCKLTEPLKPGQTYYLSVWVSRGDRPNFLGTCTNFGFRFSGTPYSEIYPCPVDNFSHYHWETAVTDTAGWTNLRGSFKADSAYSYLLFGNFYDDEHCTRSVAAMYASLFVDFVCITLDSTMCGTPGNIHQPISLPVLFPDPTGDGLFFIDDQVKKQVVSMRLLDANGQEIPLQESAEFPGAYVLPSRGVYYIELTFPKSKSREKITW